MRKTKEILRQKWAQGRSHREVARSLGVSMGAISGALQRAAAAELDWPAVASLTESELEARLYSTPTTVRGRVLPDCAWLHTERQRKGVTLALLHVEYREQHPDGYGYTQFCEHYRRWCKKHRVTMRQLHRAGEKMFVDYAGKRPSIVDRMTGERTPVELFVAVLGASSYTFAEVTQTQRSHDFIASHTRAVEFFGGVAEVTVPDQLKSGVTRACRYEPGLQRTYEDWAQHYGTTVIPARPRKPRDKAKAEAAVLVVERWIVARLRNETLYSVGQMNVRIRELLVELNDRLMRAYGQSRRERFELLDRPALRPLCRDRFLYTEWKSARVNIDYHVQLGTHFYSVPYALVRERVEIRATVLTVEVFHRGQRVGTHVRKDDPGFSTTAAHMPKAHRKHLEWTPSRLIHWGSTIGPQTRTLVAAILEERRHPEQGYRSCLGILRLAKQYGHDRLESACKRAVAVHARSYRHVHSILKHGLDQVELEIEEPNPAKRPGHRNVRGANYYH
ncbi:MAG: IS21 family transposase [bacterium]|nr:IS21 family transposase [bacterium]